MTDQAVQVEGLQDMDDELDSSTGEFKSRVGGGSASRSSGSVSPVPLDDAPVLQVPRVIIEHEP